MENIEKFNNQRHSELDMLHLSRQISTSLANHCYFAAEAKLRILLNDLQRHPEVSQYRKTETPLIKKDYLANGKEY